MLSIIIGFITVFKHPRYNLYDLTPRIIAGIKTLNDPKSVLKESVGRIFENIDFRQYHLSIKSIGGRSGVMGHTVASKHHDIIIDDQALTEHGFTKFSLPLNGGNATAVMVVHNTDKSKMMYPTFYKSDLDKRVQSLREKIVSDGILIDDDTADGLVAYFRNAGVLLSEDEDSEFFREWKSIKVKIKVKV